jgi:hypothetical protein
MAAPAAAVIAQGMLRAGSSLRPPSSPAIVVVLLWILPFSLALIPFKSNQMWVLSSVSVVNFRNFRTTAPVG